jgi:carboxyl-terminal processing protease
LLFATFALFVPIWTSTPLSDNKLFQPVTLFETILSDLETTYVDPVDTQQLFQTGIQAMLQSLDPYTEFEAKEEAQNVMESIDGKYGGVGLVIAGMTKPSAAVLNDNQEAKPADDVVRDVSSTAGSFLEKDEDDEMDEDEDEFDYQVRQQEKRRYEQAAAKGIRVVKAFEGYAFDYGLRPGDRLLAVDDQILDDKTVEQVRNVLRGTPGSPVTIQFQRDGVEGIQTVTMPRQVVRINDVKLATLLRPNDNDASVGYIRVSAFSSDTGAEVRQAILNLQRAVEDASHGERTLENLILDLRGNPGGLLTSAVDVCSLFAPKGSDIVSAKGRGFPGILYRSRVDPLIDPQRTKLVVLVNGQTASAAEIVSGAIQDLDVGVILGSERTFGKGLVQNVESLPFDTALKFTVAKYYTPSGRCIQGVNYRQGDNDNGFGKQKVAERDRATYYTRMGRLVKDGGGIEADVRVDAPKASALEITLLRSGIFNDFAALWSQNHKLTDYVNADTKKLDVVNDDTYKQFIAYVKEQQQQGNLELEVLYSKPLTDLKKTLKQSGYLGAEKSVEQLQARIVRDIENDFNKYRKDLMEDLSQSILSRYLPESMLIERGVQNDVQVQAAMQLLQTPGKYESLLARDTDVPVGAGSLQMAQVEDNRLKEAFRKSVAEF